MALVPILGPVHEGHLDLVRAAQHERTRVAACLVDVSGSCLPRDIDTDVGVLEAAQVDAVISPSAESYSLEGHRTRLRVGGLTDVLCGKVEQGCFDFAVLMTLRLINQTQADQVLLSDAQWQLCVILSQLAGDLDLEAQICIRPAFRLDTGVACSAEWQALPPHWRPAAERFAQVLADTAHTIRNGGDPARCCKSGVQQLTGGDIEGLDYLELRHAGTLNRVHDIVLGGPSRLFGAVRINGLRLVDSLPVA